MKILARLPLMALVATGAPAFAQGVMKDFSWADMRSDIVTAGLTVTSEGATDTQRYMIVKADSGLAYGVYGFECDSSEPTQHCSGAEFVASFNLVDEDLFEEALEAIDYAALADYRGEDGRLKISRYIIFDGGITHANLQANLEVFTRLTDKIWDMLDENDWLK